MFADRKPNALAWLWLSLAIIVFDQLSKQWVLRTLPEYTPVAVIPHFWNWFRSYNNGAAFSFLDKAGGWQIWLFSGLAIVISALLASWLRKARRNDWRQALPYALVIGGALGNVIDRILHGHVIDFIQWYAGSYYWPSFNIADSAIVVGAVGIALFSMFDTKKAQD